MMRGSTIPKKTPEIHSVDDIFADGRIEDEFFQVDHFGREGVVFESMLVPSKAKTGKWSPCVLSSEFKSKGPRDHQYLSSSESGLRTSRGGSVGSQSVTWDRLRASSKRARVWSGNLLVVEEGGGLGLERSEETRTCLAEHLY